MIIDNNDNIVNNQIKDCQKTVDSDKVVNSIENNDTLLISEVIGKVILPYTSKEVSEILQNDNCEYKNENEVIENVFTRPFSDYRFQIISRYNETMKLAREREDYGLTDSISLAMEMMKKRYLHPAIISACRSLNELDVYLDCLEKNEIDDFKIFKIKYELYPMIAKKSKDKFDKIQNFDSRKRRGRRYKDNGLFSKIKNIFQNDKTEENCL